MSKLDSLKSIGKFVSTAEQYGKPDTLRVLVGTKLDIRQITYEEGKQAAELYGMKYYETSAKTGEGV